MKAAKIGLFTLTAVLCTASCASGPPADAIGSFEELSTSNRLDLGEWLKFPDIHTQHRLSHAAGIIPVHSVGQATYTSARDYSSMMFGVQPDRESRSVTVTFEAPSETDAVTKLQGKLLQLQRLRTKAVQLALGKATDDVQKTIQEEFESVESAVNDIVAKGGIGVYRWSAGDRDDVSIAAKPAGDLSFNSDGHTSGFLIIAGLRVSMLVVGRDFRDRYKNLEQSAGDNVVVSTQVWQAKRVAFVSDYSHKSSATLNAAVNAAQITDQKTINDAQLKLAAMTVRITGIAGSGSFCKAKWEIAPLSSDCFDNPESANDWQTFFVVRTSPDNLLVDYP